MRALALIALLASILSMPAFANIDDTHIRSAESPREFRPCPPMWPEEALRNRVPGANLLAIRAGFDASLCVRVFEYIYEIQYSQ